MERYLMTHSLLSSWLYSIKDNPYEDLTSERDQNAEFMQALNREHTSRTAAMQNGVDFEDLVTDITNGCGNQKSNWYDAACKVASVVGGGQLQYKARKEIQVSGLTLVLYGRFDCLKAGVIYDIKFSENYEVWKYLDSTQHPTYFELVPEADKFTYLVSNGTNVWPESYRRDETPSIIPVIEDFLAWLQLHGLMGIYTKKWLAL